MGGTSVEAAAPAVRDRAHVTLTPLRVAVLAIAAWGALAAVGAAPLVGTLDPRIGASTLPAIAVAGTAFWIIPNVASHIRWRRLLLFSFAAAVVWAVALALVDGIGALTEPVSRPSEYLATAGRVGDGGAFLSGFVDRISTYPTHVRAHPPGLVLVLWALGRVGAGGPRWAAALMIAGGASAVPAALIALRTTAGEGAARAAAPFVAFAPAAVWVATSADALFAGVSAWGVALFVLALARDGVRSDVFALGSGLVLGVALFLTYGVVPLAAMPLALAVWRRRARPLALAACSVAAVALGFALAGFWWVDGLLATRRQYLAGASMNRGYAFFLIANLGALAITLGPAIIVAITKLRDAGVTVLVGGAAAAVLIADLSGLSKGEVERIWLPFVPWLVVAMSTLAGRTQRAWLAVQLLAALMIQTLLRAPW